VIQIMQSKYQIYQAEHMNSIFLLLLSINLFKNPSKSNKKSKKSKNKKNNKKLL